MSLANLDENQIKSVKFTTSNKKIETITAKGIVKDKKKGEAKITITAVDGNCKAACNVKVK